MTIRPNFPIRFLLILMLTSLALLPALWTAQAHPAPVSAHTPDLTRTVTQPLTLQAVYTATPDLLGKIHPAVLKQWSHEAHAQQPVIIYMRAQANLQRPAIVAAPSVADRRAALVNELATTAEQAQAGVLALLGGAQQADRASEIRSLWINNSIAAHVDQATLLQIAARDDVAFIQPDQYRQWIDTPIDLASSIPAPTATQWHIQRIRADQVWSALNISGTGVVVANMDTGVDWQHPELLNAYRGYTPKGLANHLYSWFDATSDGAIYPHDGYGHGTHTMGTLVGADGIGVAPGAKWIAARIFNNQGGAYTSWIHAGFQWILAPGGDPSQAPDVLSNSWGSSDGTDTEFQADVRLLNAAGIDTYFSNGNSGPDAGSVGSPASLPESFGVGAVDDTEWIAGFSSRGPSPFGLLRPDVSAPGVSILSSIPGGGYAQASGTSMAAPQAAGIAALMRSAAANLTITQTRYALTTTAAQAVVSITYPNNTYGWGRVDAFNAVVAVLQPGTISGTVRRSDTHAPIPYATIHAASRIGTWSNSSADGAGRYLLYAAPSVYTLTVSAFGFVPQTLINVPVVTGTQTQREVTLTPLPQGWVTGRSTDLTGTHALTINLSVLNAPLSITVSGSYSLALPIGTHVLRAQATAHRIVTAEVTISAGQTITHDFALPDAPTILLIDSGRWYNGSSIQYYRQALDDLNYLYDEWPIRDLSVDVPTTRTLRAYDTVIWSAPFDSPGLIGASLVISDFLSNGRHLLLSGQDVGYFDAGYPYYYNQLQVDYVADATASRQVTGARAFAGLTFAISGTGGADNQYYPDVIQARYPALAETGFYYAPDQSAGQSVGLCRPYRAMYLPFGFEAINDRAARAEVIARTFGIFARPLLRNVAGFDPASDPLIAPPGGTVTHTFMLQNFDEVAPLTFTLGTQSAWQTTVTPASASLKSCEARPVTLTVQVPLAAGRDATQPVTVTASAGGPAVTSTTVLAKAPASVLLVDDDRWYPVDGPYRSALSANGIAYDVWRVPTSWVGSDPAAPSGDRMSWYPQVIWFTGYDWYQTLTPSNTLALQAFLSQGGRVLLSSQDFLSEPGMNEFKRKVLGILSASSDYTTTWVSGTTDGLFDGLAAQPLNPPYPKYGYALAPQPAAQAALVGDHGWPVAVAQDMGISKTLFMAFGFEGLPSAAQPEVMNNAVGFLSRLGRSSVKIDRAQVEPGDLITATIVAQNDGSTPIDHAAFTLTLPGNVAQVGGDAALWTGALGVGESITRQIQLQLTGVISAGSIVTLPVEFRDGDQAIRFVRTARVNVGEPQLELSYAPDALTTFTGRVMTWTLTAHNSGALTAPVMLTLAVPFGQAWLSGTEQVNFGALNAAGDHLTWVGGLAPGDSLTATYQLTAAATWSPSVWYGSALAATDRAVWQAGGYVQVRPFQAYLPVVRKAQ